MIHTGNYSRGGINGLRFCPEIEDALKQGTADTLYAKYSWLKEYVESIYPVVDLAEENARQQDDLDDHIDGRPQ